MNKNFITKIIRRLRELFVLSFRNTLIYPFLYKSYWNYIYIKFTKQGSTEGYNYLTAIPNPGAGIGHQLANWISGYWWSQYFHLRFAHSEFSDTEWELFLGLGESEVNSKTLLSKGYKQVRLPLFNESNSVEMDRIKSIISSYNGKNVLFVCENDQYYKAQYEVIDDFQRGFFGAKARKNDKLIYDNKNFNIAIHIRRGDIKLGHDTKNPNLTMRWQNNSYFINVLSNTLKLIQTTKPVFIFIFSQGNEDDFQEFSIFQNKFFCLNMDVRDSFLHMVNADLLITSKSSFSYKPALLNRGIKVCPKNFWHYYPKTSDWILADEDGTLIL